MASKGLVIPLSLDPREWITGIRRVEDTLDDVGDDLRDTERAGDRLGRSLEDAFRDTARAADRAERSVDDVADEAADSAKEFGSAFRGDPIEALEEVQSLVAEVVRSTVNGFAGIALTLTGGVAFSALISFYEKWREEQEARIEQVREWRDEVVGAFGVLNKETFAEAFTEGLDEAGVTFSEYEDLLAALPEELRVGFRKAVQSGDLNALETVLGDIEAGAENIRDRIAEGFVIDSERKQAFLDLDDLFNGDGGLVDGLGEAVLEAQALARVLGNDVTDAAGKAADATGSIGGVRVPGGVAPIGGVIP